jgi:hypothetical protein
MRTHEHHFGISSGMQMDFAELGRGARILGLGAVVSGLLAGCASSGISTRSVAQAETLAPVEEGNVSTSALPPIGPNGEVQGPAPLEPDTMTPAQIAAADSQAGVNAGLTTANNGSFDTLPPVGALPNSSGRDLTGGLTVEKLLGRWTVVSGADQCQLNLTQTAKTGTSRYRASAPACGLQGLSVVASWQLAGSQVQLFDNGGNIIAALILSGSRFIGTLSGGQGISMVG